MRSTEKNSMEGGFTSEQARLSLLLAHAWINQ
jgi:hypothetical protein